MYRYVQLFTSNQEHFNLIKHHNVLLRIHPTIFFLVPFLSSSHRPVRPMSIVFTSDFFAAAALKMWRNEMTFDNFGATIYTRDWGLYPIDLFIPLYSSTYCSDRVYALQLCSHFPYERIYSVWLLFQQLVKYFLKYEFTVHNCLVFL